MPRCQHPLVHSSLKKAISKVVSSTNHWTGRYVLFGPAAPATHDYRLETVGSGLEALSKQAGGDAHELNQYPAGSANLDFPRNVHSASDSTNVGFSGFPANRPIMNHSVVGFLIRMIMQEILMVKRAHQKIKHTRLACLSAQLVPCPGPERTALHRYAVTMFIHKLGRKAHGS
ncbi:hypothetical protein P175DRAFT_0533981 [Aspergillus ochraceoroseus IBT 24754]|uniref:Uncharacterized protein n=1 Tax=Aspergillus ochraceoroseus IBT 24754 TaxID=1392256 RepID=A0A2T5LTE2_9EURO|nr:uncharacterized protein P175DRAFT_0533981 [Aspergillus ochraceoroseus IBT 24754]PTU19541.1 hypothetical protein P175DRAFT_0533981 [Aspergillus ochraceoroseus IBT 24754]